MSTEIKPILILILVCATILSIGMVKVEKTKNKPTETVSNNVITEDANETIESEIIEEPEEELEATESTETETLIDYDDYNVPSNNSIKSYMDYRHITSKNSRQYQLQNSLAYTDSYGIRMVGDRYCVAVGSYYTTTIGQYIDIELENGQVIQGILADCKDDSHTDSANQINPNGSVVEFVVDTNMLDEIAKIMGDLSYIGGWNSKVVNIKVYDFVEEF